MSSSDKQDQKREIGEGDRESARRYNSNVREFVESTDVEQAARDAEPRSEEEKEALREAEREGKSRAKERDPDEAFDPSKSS